MRYQGGKVRQAAKIVPHILAANPVRYVEPFVGGASIACKMIESGFAGPMVLSDILPDLVLLWRAGLDGWVPPAEMSRAEYDCHKIAPPSAGRAWAGIAASHSGKWFGGYGVKAEAAGRDYLKEAQRSFLRRVALLQTADVTLEIRSFCPFDPLPGDVIYADPPYANTTGYGNGHFDNEAFWRVMSLWSHSNAVFVSEFDAPLGWASVLEVKRAATLDPSSSKLSVEYLFMRQA